MTNRALVLMYHRIADLDNDPWQLAVSPSNFEQQLKILKKNYRLISVNELINHLSRKSIPKHCVCITFDDGYRDNYLTAKPLLEKYECPATFFISSHYIERQSCFWWDELLEIILEPESLPQKISLIINKESFEFFLEDDSVLTDEQRENLKSWVWNEKYPNRRCELYLELWERLRLLRYDKLQVVLDGIKSWAAANGTNKQNLPMTTKQLCEIADRFQFDLALHTVTHLYLSAHPKETQFEEIEQNKEFLENNSLDFTKVIAYPFGNFDETTISAAKELGLIAGFTTEIQTVTNDSKLYQLGRFQVNDWDGNEFESRILNWIKNY